MVCVSFQSLYLVQTGACVFVHHHVSLPLPHHNVSTDIAALNSTHLLCHNFWKSGVWARPCWCPAAIRESARAAVSPDAWLGEEHVQAPMMLAASSFLWAFWLRASGGCWFLAGGPPPFLPSWPSQSQKGREREMVS